MALLNSTISGLATYGKWRAYASSAVSWLLVLLLVFSAASWFFAKDPTVPATAVVKESSCSSRTYSGVKNRPTTEYTCSLTVTHTFGGQTYTTKKTHTGSKPYGAGAILNGRVDPSDPGVFDLGALSNKRTSAIMCALACLVAVCALSELAVARNRTASALSGARGLLDFLS